LGRKKTSWDLFLRDAEMVLTVRGVIRAEDVLRCLMFEVDPGRRSVGCRSDVWWWCQRSKYTTKTPFSDSEWVGVQEIDLFQFSRAD